MLWSNVLSQIHIVWLDYIKIQRKKIIWSYSHYCLRSCMVCIQHLCLMLTPQREMSSAWLVLKDFPCAHPDTMSPAMLISPRRQQRATKVCWLHRNSSQIRERPSIADLRAEREVLHLSSDKQAIESWFKALCFLTKAKSEMSGL